MRKLALILLFVFALPLLAQVRDLRGTVIDDATSDCMGEKLPRLQADGTILDGCLPTQRVDLTWVITNPGVAATTYRLNAPNFAAATVVAVFCKTEGGGSETVSLNFDSRDRASNTPGTDLHTSEFVADHDGMSSTSFSGDASSAANQDWNLSVSAVANAPTSLKCSLTLRKN